MAGYREGWRNGGTNKYWFDRIRAQGLCYLCRRSITDPARITHKFCNQLSSKGYGVKQIRTVCATMPLEELNVYAPKGGGGRPGRFIALANVPSRETETWQREAAEVRRVEAREQELQEKHRPPQLPPKPRRSLIYNGQEFEVIYDGT